MNMLVGAATFTATATPVIAAAEATSPNPMADSKLLALADEYVVAEQRWGDLVRASMKCASTGNAFRRC